MEIKDRKMLIVGLGKTGMDTARFLASRGAKVSATDISDPSSLADSISELEALGVEVEAGGHTEDSFLRAETVVLSPGVPFHIPPVKTASDNGAEVISEVELASRFIDRPVIAVTGSNGKTTTSSLIAAVLKRNGFRVFLGANIGTPLISIADSYDEYDVLVLELSSFQLQGVTSFRPDIAALLNISPNHLDHHRDFDEYIDSKMKICANQTEDDLIIYNDDDEIIKERIGSARSGKIPFGRNPGGEGIFASGYQIIFRGESYDLSGMKLRGGHNIENAMAAVAATRTMGCDAALVAEAIINFDPLPHRNEYVRDFKGAFFYNDSKSTSPGATLRALESAESPVILIAGGKDKGVSLDALKGIINEKVRVLVLFGESRLRMKSELGFSVETVLADTLEDAVAKCVEKLDEGDTVLFSPACSSFDMFSSYEERGRRYREIVQTL